MMSKEELLRRASGIPNTVTRIDRIEYPDSIEFGAAGSRLKVYFNADNEEQAKARVDVAKRVRDHALK